MDNKVDKEPGKGLSSNDYTSEEKTLVGTIINKVDKVQGKGLSTYDLTESRKNKLDSYPELTGAGNKALMDNGTFVEITGEGIIFSDIEIINIEDLQVEYVTEEIYNKIANAIINNRHIVLNSINRSDVSPFSLRAAEPINVITYSVIRQEYLNFTNRDIFLVITDGTTTTEITIESTFHVTIIKRPSSISLDNSNPLPTVELTQTSIGLQANLVLAKSNSGVQLVKTEDGLVAQFKWDGEDQEIKLKYVTSQEYSSLNEIDQGTLYFITDNRYIMFQGIKYGDNISREGINDIKELLNQKVDKEEGKGLSSNDYSDSDKSKVDKIITSGEGDKYLSDNGKYLEIPESPIWVITLQSEDTEAELLSLYDEIVEKSEAGYVIYLNVQGMTYPCITIPMTNTMLALELYSTSNITKGIFLNSFIIDKNNNKVTEATSSLFFTGTFTLDSLGDGTKFLSDDGKYKEISIDKEIETIYITFTFSTNAGAYFAKCPSDTYSKVANAVNNKKGIIINFEDPYSGINSYNLFAQSIQERTENGQIYYDLYTISQLPTSITKENGLQLLLKVITITPNSVVFIDDLEGLDRMLEADIILLNKGNGTKFLSDDGTYKKVVLTDYLPLSAGSENKLTGDLYFANGTKVSGSEENILSSDAQIEGAAFITPNNSGYIIKDSEGNNRTVLGLDSNNVLGVGVASGKTVLYSNSDLIHYTSGAEYKIWDENNLIDPATKPGDNTFTGTNSFVEGKFSVGGFKVSSTHQLYINLSQTGGWERSLTWINNNENSGRIRFGSFGNGNIAEYAWIGIGDVAYNTAQYRFYNTSMRVPSVWSLDDAGGNSFIQSQSTQLINFGRSAGTTKIRSGVTDLIHTKETTDYTIWDASNLSDPVTKSGDNIFIGNNTFTAGKFNVGVFSINNLSSLTVDVGTNAGAWSRYLRFMADSSATGAAYGAYSSSDGSINYAWIGVEDTEYSNAQYKFYPDKLYVSSKWELVDKGTDTSLILYSNAESQHLGRAIGVTYIRSGDDDLYHTKSSTNYKILDESNWQGVANSKSVVAFITANGYPTVGRLDGSDIGWLRTPTNGLLPTSPVSLANDGDSSLGNSSWSFNSASIANVYANRYYFGSTSTYLSSDANYISILNNGTAKGMKVGSLLVSSNYANHALIPINGIFSSGRIQSNDSMIVGYSHNVTNGMLGYGLYYDNTFAQGLGSEYSSGALILYKILNPNTGKAGYNVPRATTGTPTYLKINNGTLTLGVGETKAYTAGEDVTITEYPMATQNWANETFYPINGKGFLSFDSSGRPVMINNQGYAVRDSEGNIREVLWMNPNNALYIGNTSTYTLEAIQIRARTTTVNGSLVVSAMGSLPVIINNSDSNGTDVIQTFRVQGYNRFLVGWSETSGGPFIQRSSDNSCILIKSDGAYWGSSLGASALKKLATQEWVLEQLEALKTS